MSLQGELASIHKGGGFCPFIIRWEVERMNFDFKDLMAFGMFILALLTFIFNNRK